MNGFLLYIVRSGLYLGLFYAFYILVMRRTTFFRFNRAALLTGSLSCVLLPLLRVRTAPVMMVAAGPLTMTDVSVQADGTAAAAVSWPSAVLALYLTGAAIVIGHTLFSALALRRKVSGGRRQRLDGIRTVILEEDIPSFTFGKTVFIGRKDLSENPVIFRHETMHVKCRHYLDLFFFRAIQLVWWWNPLVWMARTELGLLHEYEADEGVINQGIDATQYQILLVRKAVGEQRFSLASGFQHAKLKNRIAMMLKPSSSVWMRWSYLALIPVLAACMFACNPARNTNNQAADAQAESIAVDASEPAPEQESVPYQLIENKPIFDGGDANSFAKWVNSNLNYPEEAKKNKIEGRVTLQFTVGADGVVRDVEVLRGVNELLDAEAVKVVSASPKWEPGTQDGKPVPVQFVFPIIFKLK